MATAQDLANFDKLFSGTWEFVRNENLEAFHEAQGASADAQMAEKHMKPTCIMSVKDGAIQWTMMEKDKYELGTSFKLGEPFEFKDRPENPRFHTKQTTIMRGDEMHEENESCMEGGGKPYTTAMRIVNGEMITTTTIGEVKALRIFRRIA